MYLHKLQTKQVKLETNLASLESRGDCRAMATWKHCVYPKQTALIRSEWREHSWKSSWFDPFPCFTHIPPHPHCLSVLPPDVSFLLGLLSCSQAPLALSLHSLVWIFQTVSPCLDSPPILLLLLCGVFCPPVLDFTASSTSPQSSFCSSSVSQQDLCEVGSDYSM